MADNIHSLFKLIKEVPMHWTLLNSMFILGHRVQCVFALLRRSSKSSSAQMQQRLARNHSLSQSYPNCCTKGDPPSVSMTVAAEAHIGPRLYLMPAQPEDFV